MNPLTRILASMLALGAPSLRPARAQDTTRFMITPYVTPSSLARVLAEVAQDIRTGRPTYLVATRRFPEYVVGVYDTPAAAQNAARDSGLAEYGAFGPYETAPDSATGEQVTTDSVVVFSHTTKGSERVRVDPREVDALFLTPAAVDKFMIPFYSYLYGPRIAEQLRIRILQLGKPPVCHNYTRPCIVTRGLPRVPLGDGEGGHN